MIKKKNPNLLNASEILKVLCEDLKMVPKKKDNEILFDCPFYDDCRIADERPDLSFDPVKKTFRCSTCFYETKKFKQFLNDYKNKHHYFMARDIDLSKWDIGIEIEPQQRTKLSWIIKTNDLGQKEYHLTCPQCQEEFVSLKRNVFYRHLWNEHQIQAGLDPEKQTKKAIGKIEAEKQLLKSAKRVFYVDTAKSIESNAGVRYWKSVLVENNKLLAEFANSKVVWTNGAEAYAVLKAIYWMIENKVEDRIVIRSDNMIVVKRLQNQNLTKLEKKYPKRNDKDKFLFE